MSRDEEASAAADDTSSTEASGRPSKFLRSTSSSGTAGLSSSYSLPSRSYIHHAAFAAQDVRYSSPGVREQTAELSSSFLTDSGVSRHLSPDRGDSEMWRRHATIEERSEPVTPEGKSPPTSAPSELSKALRGESHGAGAVLDRKSSNFDSTAATKSNTTSKIPAVIVPADEVEAARETSPLLPRERLPPFRRHKVDTSRAAEQQSQYQPGIRNQIGRHCPSPQRVWFSLRQVLRNPLKLDFRQCARRIIIEPATMLPAVFLGVLLNLLDALSYGIILFPLGEEAFSNLGPDGVSMFYVSCIISQLTYSTGSIFKGGVGSEMIEVVPFFHKMTYMIMGTMGTEDAEALRATVITSYAMSSVITGLVFFVLGSARLGTLVNFFPHSILTGCIGGVGIFLFITGIEVSARLDGNLEFSMATLEKLFSAATVALWIPPLALAIILLVIKRYYDRPWLVPTFYIAITAIFYIITSAVPSISMNGLRNAGWVFEAPAASAPFYNFYRYYKFALVDWGAIWKTVPSQLALTFFGILHVPINVPNLAMVVQEDNVSINRELIMHGISNTLSGCVGSIQNYLVFVNSVLFMETGGNSRLAGYLLAAATFGLWVAGPVVIGYVPVMVVGTLIYMLGIDLTKDAIWSTYGKLHRLEYWTIVAIAIVMGFYDFVVGIAIGIALACLVYVVQTSQKNVIRAEFTGQVAESTVRRHPRQRSYLHMAGSQIRVAKLGGYLFFGSIVNVEKKVRALIDAEAFAASPIRYLVLDFTHVTGIDFSAAEAFSRMNRIVHKRDVKMIMAGVTLGSDVGRSLRMVGLFEAEDPSVPVPKVFETLNEALEAPVPIQDHADVRPSPFDGIIGSPRRHLLDEAAHTVITETIGLEQAKWQTFKQPLPLLLQAFQGLTDKTADFWFRAVPYFTKREFTKGQMLYTRGDNPDGFYLLQSGILRAEYYLQQGNYHESIVAGTTCGELPFFSETERTSTVIAEQDCVAWLLTPEKWQELQDKDPEVAKELLKVGLKLSAERMNAITSYVLITAS